MAQLFDTIREIFHYLRQYKARTFMTMFGIIWGTISIVVLLAFGVGVQHAMSKNMHGIGEGIVIIWAGKTGKPFQGFNRGRQIHFRESDVDLMQSEIRNIDMISPEYSTWRAAIHRGSKSINPNITGANQEYGLMRHERPQRQGRWLNELDIEEKRRVVFLGNDLKEFLFGDEEAVGQYVNIGDSPFLVIGVLREKTQASSYNSRDKDRAFIPYTTFRSFFGHRYLSNIIYKMHDPTLNEQTRKRVYQVIGKEHKFDPEDSEALWIWDTSESDEFIYYFSLGFNIFMGIIGIMTLTVGGIGLANIMYVVVQERTREIGIRRSIGAKRKHIMLQFMTEAIIIISFGAFIGFTASLLLVKLIGMLPFDEYVGNPSISLPVVVVSISVLGLIGIIAGFFPARKAANMTVIDSIRF